MNLETKVTCFSEMPSTSSALRSARQEDLVQVTNAFRHQREKLPCDCMSHVRPALYARSVILASSISHGPYLFSSLILTARTFAPRLRFRTLSSHRFASMAPIERVTDKLEAPTLDDRSYRVIRLPNKLEALLVHDPDTDKAGAAVNVNVGSFSDADDMPGMAHAVEHLLFMGTKKVSSTHQGLAVAKFH